jgi:hypothetical protein
LLFLCPFCSTAVKYWVVSSTILWALFCVLSPHQFFKAARSRLKLWAPSSTSLYWTSDSKPKFPLILDFPLWIEVWLCVWQDFFKVKGCFFRTSLRLELFM